MNLGATLLFWSALVRMAYGYACPAIYSRYSSMHTYCKPPNNQCYITYRGVTQNDISIILNAHNYYRNEIALGNDGYIRQSAADMLEMVWNQDLANVAQAHAEQCMFQHDCYACRKTVDFDVGQNIYQLSNPHSTPRATDWSSVVSSWYSEIQYFHPNGIYNFQPQSGIQIGHFTQVIWARSWAIGCGYVEHNEGSGVRQLYTCNYGPQGNVRTNKIYEAGPACSRCPGYTCCDGCNGQLGYRGLCQIQANSHPVYGRPTVQTMFFCDFGESESCNVYTPQGQPQWNLHHLLTGSYMGITLYGGQYTTLVFNTYISASPRMCISLLYRKGANVAGQQINNSAQLIIKLVDSGATKTRALTSNSPDFIMLHLNSHFNERSLISVSFSVPSGAPPQYFEVKELSTAAGQCVKTT